MKIKKTTQRLFAAVLVLCVSILFITSCATEPIDNITADAIDTDLANKANPLANIKTSNGWADSFSVNGKCYCKSTYDHGIGNVKVGNKTVRQICEAMKNEMKKAYNGPGKKTLYNTVQCGHAPAHTDKAIKGSDGKKHADEVLCPGEVGNGIKCNSRKGPKWDGSSNPDPDPNPGNNKAPSVSFASPANNTTLTEGYNKLYVKANASDSDGSITEVKFYIDNKFIRMERKSPYEWGHSNTFKNETLDLSVGTHTLKAEAKDNDGATKTASITIEVVSKNPNPNPTSNMTIGFDSPSAGTTLKKGYSNLYIKANTSISSGSIKEVRLYIDNQFIRRERVNPYEWGHNDRLRNETRNLSEGKHTLKLVAENDKGETETATREITVTK